MLGGVEWRYSRGSHRRRLRINFAVAYSCRVIEIECELQLKIKRVPVCVSVCILHLRSRPCMRKCGDNVAMRIANSHAIHGLHIMLHRQALYVGSGLAQPDGCHVPNIYSRCYSRNIETRVDMVTIGRHSQELIYCLFRVK